mgnify:CR=1 FL=1
MEDALEAYDQALEAYFSEYADMDDDDDILWDDEELPFWKIMKEKNHCTRQDYISWSAQADSDFI